MDAETIALVQRSFDKVVANSEFTEQWFYADLLVSAPQVKPLFKGNMEEQGMKFLPTLGMLVHSLDDLVTVIPIAGALARRHVEFGVRPEHYDAVGASLIRTLERSLAAEFTPEVRTACEDAYTTLSAAMIEAAYGAEEELD